MFTTTEQVIGPPYGDSRGKPRGGPGVQTLGPRCTNPGQALRGGRERRAQVDN